MKARAKPDQLDVSARLAVQKAGSSDPPPLFPRTAGWLFRCRSNARIEEAASIGGEKREMDAGEGKRAIDRCGPVPWRACVGAWVGGIT